MVRRLFLLFFCISSSVSFGADLSCSLRKLPVGLLMANFGNEATDNCLPECRIDPANEVAHSLQSFTLSLQPLSKENIAGLSAEKLFKRFNQISKNQNDSVNSCIIKERAVQADREATLSCLKSQKKSAALFTTANRAYKNYQDALIKSLWHKKFLNMGFSSRMACSISEKQLEAQIFILIQNRASLTEDKRKEILDLILNPKATQETQNQKGEESGICKRFNQGSGVPNGFSNAILKGCI